MTSKKSSSRDGKNTLSDVLYVRRSYAAHGDATVEGEVYVIVVAELERLNKQQVSGLSFNVSHNC